MAHLITASNDITPEWLTGVLNAAGALERGHVTAVHATVQDTITAKALPLAVRYSPDAAGSCPERLFLKLGSRKPEVDFYLHIAPWLRHVPTLRCYDAVFDAGQTHLLFDDISTTHYAPPDALPMQLPIIERMVDIMADLHYQWWEHPDLKKDGAFGTLLDNVPRYVMKQSVLHFQAFVDLLGDRLSPKRKVRYERILASLPLAKWHERMAQHQNVTLIHGDTHWWNFAYPFGEEPIYLLDWAVWHLNIGAADVAYLLTLYCYPEHRERIEEPLVRRYHKHLGIEGYTWEQCWEDYRMAVVFHTLWPIFWHPFVPEGVWWHSLERIMLAFEDLHCEELLT
jgi:hypothetical protein